MLHLFKQPHCPACLAPKWSFAEGNSSSLQLRYYMLYFQKIILATQGDEMERQQARHYLEEEVVGSSKGVVWKIKCISLMSSVISHLLPTIYLGMFTHFINSVHTFREHHSRIDTFKHCWAMIPAYSGCTQLDKQYRQGMEWSGKEMNALGRMIVLVISATV